MDEKNKFFSVLLEKQKYPIVDFFLDNRQELKEMNNTFNKKLKEFKIDKFHYNERLTLNDRMQLVYDFLEYVSPKYREQFDNFVNNGSFRFVSPSSNRNSSHMDFVNDKNGEVRYDIVVTEYEDILDVYSIIHEFFHTTNENGKFSFSKTMFTESISIFYELLLFDFLKHSDIDSEEIIYPIYERIENTLDGSNYLNKEIEYIEEIFKDYSNIKEVKLEDEEYRKVYKNLRSSIIYTFSSVLAFIMYYDYKNYNITLDNIEEFNNRLKMHNNLDVMNHILIHDLDDDYIEKAVDFLKKDIKLKEKTM